MNNPSTALYIGLMSGTSLDSVDAALLELGDNHIRLVNTLEFPIPETLRQELINLCQPGENEIDRLGAADRTLGHVFADAVHALLDNCKREGSSITAIGSHGQTIRHRPHGNKGFTLQIGDANTIAHKTGITTVADFRRRDIAAGGQGAPLAPAFHKAAFSSEVCNRAIVNIGGMANVTYLSRCGNSLGFDTGPGNILLDSWIQHTLDKKYDKDGSWAASGSPIAQLLAKFLSDPYLQLPAPKSTGREDFNLQWLQRHIGSTHYNAADIQATLLEFTAQTLSDAISKLPEPVNEVLVCGGGAYNSQLMLRLETLLHPRLLANTEQLGIAAQWVEAAAFAWLAARTLSGLSGNLPSVTGADSEEILGAIYPGAA